MKQTYLFLSILVALTFGGFSQTLTVNSQSITCATLGSATVTANGGIGPFSYTWAPTSQTASVATSLSPGTYTIYAFDAGANSNFTASVIFNSLVPLTGTLSASGFLRCNGVPTGTAGYTNLTGGSGNETYAWTNGSTTLTVPMPLALGAGTWTSIVSDALTGCSISNTFAITQPPALTLTAVASTPTACPGNSITLTASGSGGTGPLSYLWANGSATNTNVVSQSVSGTYVFTVEIKDANTCSKTETISVIFNLAPTIFVSSASGTNVCVGGTVVLGATGSSVPQIQTYQWSGPSGFSSSLQSPTISPASSTNSGVYTVTVTAANTCTASASNSIAILALPAIVASGNPACESQTISLSAYSPTGAFYTWTGPNGFTSNVQYPLISPAGLTNAGTYTVVVSGLQNTCTASATTTISVLPKPVITVAGSTVCVNQTMTMSATSSIGTFFSWTGPSAFTSPNPTVVIGPASLAQSGTYTVLATGANGCPNTTTVSGLVKALPTLSLSSNSPVCNGQPLFLISTSAVSHAWSGPNAFNTAVQNPTINPALVNNSGVYSATVTGVNGCTANASTSVIVNPTPTLSAMGSTVCEGQPLNLSASSVAGAAYNWMGPLSFISSTQSFTINQTTSQMSGIYQVTVMDAAGCTNTTSVNALVNFIPTPFIIYNNNVCAGKNIQMASATAGAAYSWSGPAGFTSTLPTPTINNATINQSGVYGLTVTAANTCTGSESAMINVNPLPVISVISQTVCAGTNLQLGANSLGATAYTWSGPNNYSSTVANPILFSANVSLSGNYTVTVNSISGCTNQAVALGSIVALPVITTTMSSDIICAKESATMSASGANSYTWSTSALNYIVIVSPTVTTTYTVFGTGTYSCGSSAVTTLTVDLCSGINTLVKTSLFVIYPNPAQKEIIIQTNGSSYQSVSIINGVGQLIKTIQTDQVSLHAIDLTGLDNGIYFLQITSEAGVETKRFVVNR